MRRSGRLVEAAMGSPWVARSCGAVAYQAMDLSRPKRMMRPRAAARRMAQVSVDRLKVERVLGVDMWSLLKDARCTRRNVWWRML